MQHDIGLGEPGDRVQREVADIAGTGAGEPDMAGPNSGTSPISRRRASETVIVLSRRRRRL